MSLVLSGGVVRCGARGGEAGGHCFRREVRSPRWRAAACLVHASCSRSVEVRLATATPVSKGRVTQRKERAVWFIESA